MGQTSSAKESSQSTQKNTDAKRASQSKGPVVETLGLQSAEAALEDPLSASPATLLQLQRRYGNRAVQRLIQRAQAGELQRPAAVGLEGGQVVGDLQHQINSARGGGQSLDQNVGSQIGGALGADFSGVRVHTDSNSDTLNRSLSAKAFTLGSDVFFSKGAYNPGTHSGKQLLAHELTHVVQQGGSRANKVQTKLTVGPAGDKYEEEADRVAGQVMRMPLADRVRRPASRLQRQPVTQIQRAVMDLDAFKTATGTRSRGGYIKQVDKALTKYKTDETPGNLTALRFAIEKYLATKGEDDSDKVAGAKKLLSEVIDTAGGQSQGDQMQGLLAVKNELKALAGKAKILKGLDAKLKGADKYLREDLKKAIIESSKTPEALETKVNGLNLIGALDEGQRKLVTKLVKELQKGNNPGKVAIYHSLYARCMEMASAMYQDHEHQNEFMATLQDPEAKDLVRPMIDIARMSAESLDVSYAKKLTQQRDMSQAELKAQGKEALDVVVMGAGPVGMIAAMEAQMAGANVHVYEMRRTGPARSNVLKLTDATFQKLRRLGIYGDLFGPDSPKGDNTETGSHGVSVAFLEDTLRARAAQMGVKITYGYQLETITAPEEEGGKTTVRLKKYVPTRPGPEMDLYQTLEDQPDYIDATSDLVIGATGAGGTTRSKLGLESERREGEEGEEYIDFTAVGIFEADHKPGYAPGVDKDRDNAWMVGLRTPTVDYLLTQITREQFLRFKDNKGERDAFVADRGKTVAKYDGALKQSSVFDITLNQAQQFVNEESSGVLIGDEAATPHPLTGSGFNTGAATTELVPGLVKGIAKGNKSESFKKYSEGTKSRTDVMVGKGAKFFEKNIKKLTEMNKLPPEPEEVEEETPPERSHYTPEDIGVTEETQGAYDFAQQRVMAQLGMRTGLHEFNLEEYGPDYDDPEAAYEAARRKVEALFNIPQIREDD